MTSGSSFDRVFSDADRRGRPFEAHGLSGRAWGSVPEDLASSFRAWLEHGIGPGEERLSPAVFRRGTWAVKLFPAPSPFGWLRAPRALRSARRYFDCLPIPSPRPLVALAQSRRHPSLLVREFLEGTVLSALWGRDADSERELPAFLAELRRAPLLHGDLHPGNLLWTGSRWVLLDVDGLRHGLHLRGRVLLGQWASLASKLDDEPRVERLFRRTLELAPGLDETRWDDVRVEAARRREKLARLIAARAAAGVTAPPRGR